VQSHNFTLGDSRKKFHTLIMNMKFIIPRYHNVIERYLGGHVVCQ